MKKYCKFLQDVTDKGEIIWHKDAEHLITYEDYAYYCFGEPMINGISKEYKDKLFTVREVK